jgi:ribonuclease P protein component
VPPPRLTLRKAQRLTSGSEFERVRREGFKIRGSFVSLGVLSDTGNGFRAGFITSRKLGTAVLRNRVRRRLREIVRLHRSQLSNDVWIVVIALPGAAKTTYRELEAEWLLLARRASILAA